MAGKYLGKRKVCVQGGGRRGRASVCGEEEAERGKGGEGGKGLRRGSPRHIVGLFHIRLPRHKTDCGVFGCTKRAVAL